MPKERGELWSVFIGPDKGFPSRWRVTLFPKKDGKNGIPLFDVPVKSLPALKNLVAMLRPRWVVGEESENAAAALQEALRRVSEPNASAELILQNRTFESLEPVLDAWRARPEG